MMGLNAQTGKLVSDGDYLKSRVFSCLSMREGSHPMRRKKGSRTPELLDRPLNSATLFDIQVAVMDALDSPQNGFQDILVKQVKAVSSQVGGVSIELIYQFEGQIKTLDGILITR